MANNNNNNNNNNKGKTLESTFNLSRDETLLVAEYLGASDAQVLTSTAKRFWFVRTAEWLWKGFVAQEGMKSAMNLVDDLVDDLEPLAAAPAQTLRPACKAFAAYKALSVLHRVPVVAAYELKPNRMSSREGHAQCVIHGKAFARGGFCNDEHAWFQDGIGDGVRVRRAVPETNGEDNQQQQHEEYPWVYGHRMTAISNNRCLTFGGCQSGGYRNCSNILAITEVTNPRPRAHSTSSHDEDEEEQDRPTFTDLLVAPLFQGENNRPLIPPTAYHGQCIARFVDPDTGEDLGPHVWIFLGLMNIARHHREINKAFVIPVSLLTAEKPSKDAILDSIRSVTIEGFEPTEESNQRFPCGRFGFTAESTDGENIYVAGGYTGSGIYAYQDGDDLTDMYRLNVKRLRWERVVESLPFRGCLGRCHSANTFGPLILYYGGTVPLSRRLVAFDTRTEQFIIPHSTTKAEREEVPAASAESEDQVSGSESSSSSGGSEPSIFPPPTASAQPRPRRVRPRLSHGASVVGTKLVVTGGWSHEAQLAPVVLDLAYTFTSAQAMAATEANSEDGAIHIRRALTAVPAAMGRVEEGSAAIADFIACDEDERTASGAESNPPSGDDDDEDEEGMPIALQQLVRQIGGDPTNPNHIAMVLQLLMQGQTGE